MDEPKTNGATKSEGPKSQDVLFGLSSNRPVAFDLYGGDLPCRLEGEVSDLIVLGEIPKEINGTFYRVMLDPFVPPHPKNVPLDGDGNVSAFRIYDGRVDMKMRYIETERYKLERKANKALFGLYRNPFSHHPCVRAAVDSTANTNLVFWAEKLLALKESALPYRVDPYTLDTLEYDPFPGQVKSKTFTAHPRVDPYTNELIVFGYEATGLASLDIATYALDKNGKKVQELWVKSPWCAPIHDCAITKNWLVLMLWPFECTVERMKAGGHHWAWDYNLPATLLVVPRRKDSGARFGWKEGERREYTWKNCMPIHFAGGWEDEDGKIYVESSRVHDNAFPFFPTNEGVLPSFDPKADFVRWELDPNLPNGTQIKDPKVIIDVPAEFPRIDERFMTSQYEYLFLNVVMPGHADQVESLFLGLNGLAMHSHRTGKTKYFYPGDDSLVQEPIFIPRSKDAPEGDGWVMALVERTKAKRCDLVVIDTREFEKPIAIVQLPLRMKAQVHGNWINSSALKDFWERPLVRQVPDTKISGRGSLEPGI